MNRPASPQRQNQRFNVELDCALKHGEQTDFELKARALNASLGGLYLELDHKLPLGERVRVRFDLPGHVVETDAIVRWHDDRGLGVQFDGLRARDVWALERYFRSL